MSRVVLTKKMLEMIETGIDDRIMILTDELSHISCNSVTDCDPSYKEDKKKCEADMKLCNRNEVIMRSKVYYDPMYEIEQHKDQRIVKQYLQFFNLITKLIRSL